MADVPPVAPADEPYCYLTTVGRVTGRPHTIEIWFALDGSTLYLLSGGGTRADWVRNLVAHPAVSVRIGSRELPAIARLVDDDVESSHARGLLYAKYADTYAGDLGKWRDTALPVAVDVDGGASGP